MRFKLIINYIKILPVFFIGIAFGQKSKPIAYRVLNDPTRFYIGSSLMEQPFTGGFNAPQFCHFDLNIDGELDIIVFDRYDSKIMPYIRVGKDQFVYEPRYEHMLPKGNFYYKSGDINSDGYLDIFTASKTGNLRIHRFIPTGNPAILKFESSDDIYYRNQNPDDGSVLYNVLSSPISDIPEIKDMDGDGDLDFVTYDGGAKVYRQFRDVRVENGWSRDTFEFQIMDICFGYFNEGADNSIVLGQCPPNSLKLKPRHANGSACFLHDFDSDGDLEFVISNIGYNNFTFLENGKQQAKSYWDTMVNFDTMFPANTKYANGFIFPAGYMIDASGDGVADLLVSPNGVPDAKETQQIWYYKNVGTGGKTKFEFQRTNFLIDKTLDFGGKSAPVFVDYDADGDKDLLIANNGDYGITLGQKDKITLFLNKGNKDSAAFHFEKDDILHSIIPTDSVFMHSIPAIGDVDNDGDEDLLIGTLNGYVHWFENIAGANNPVYWVYKDSNIAPKSTLFSESDAAPCIYDFDFDGKNDLLVGYYNGKVVAFKSDGNNSPKFSRVTDQAYGAKANEYRLDINPPGYVSFGNAVPRVADLNNDGKIELILGAAQGTPKLYQIDQKLITDNVPMDSLWILQYTLTGDSMEAKIGQRSAPDFADLNGDTIPEMIFGIGRGGLIWANSLIYPRQKSSVSSFSNNNNVKFSLYPNPVTNELNIHLMDGHINDIQIFSIDGREIIDGFSVLFNHKDHALISWLEIADGPYLLKVIDKNDNQFTRMFVIQN